MTFDLGVRKEKEFVKHSGRRGIKDRRVMVDKELTRVRHGKKRHVYGPERVWHHWGRMKGQETGKELKSPSTCDFVLIPYIVFVDIVVTDA